MLGAGIVFAIWWFSTNARRCAIVLEARGDINGLGEQSRVRLSRHGGGERARVGIDPEDLRTLLVRIAVPVDLPLTRGTDRPRHAGVTGLAFVQLDDRGDDSRAAADGERRASSCARAGGGVSGVRSEPSTSCMHLERLARLATIARSSACMPRPAAWSRQPRRRSRVAGTAGDPGCAGAA